MGRVLIGFLYIFYKIFKSQYSTVLLNCTFVRFWYRFISFGLGFKSKVRVHIVDHELSYQLIL